MPEFYIDSAETESTSASLQSKFHDLVNTINMAKSDVDALIANGYKTPAAEQKFGPYFAEFHQGVQKVLEGLDGISQYVKAVGTAFEGTDTELAKNF
ncbi:hypothetical protein Afil01_59950 [Actinorhabdospora filicis]|uniref:WXG100 family type VII secretion target n=1 Tax=Actinorhabdospora filicis TaxID=1785913 RepID=A0A9W6WCK9_9ACTN|nr:WXG100 family type VII secretion target [Actinorhabdospora filicis]GLZ81188.1 hypothetical protein Afil01_59950 [Actinorhabdospora filicis]